MHARASDIPRYSPSQRDQRGIREALLHALAADWRCSACRGARSGSKVEGERLTLANLTHIATILTSPQPSSSRGSEGQCMREWWDLGNGCSRGLAWLLVHHPSLVP